MIFKKEEMKWKINDLNSEYKSARKTVVIIIFLTFYWTHLVACFI